MKPPIPEIINGYEYYKIPKVHMPPSINQTLLIKAISDYIQPITNIEGIRISHYKQPQKK